MPLCDRPNLCTSTEMEVTPGTEKSKRRLRRRRSFAAFVVDDVEGEGEEGVVSSFPSPSPVQVLSPPFLGSACSDEAASFAKASTKPPRQQSTCFRCFLCCRC